MKNSNYNTQQVFESLVREEQERTAPSVNVRVAVREGLRSEQIGYDREDALEIIANWFSGARGKVVTTVALCAVLAMALVGYQQLLNLQDSQTSENDDFVSSFIDDGDWSELL